MSPSAAHHPTTLNRSLVDLPESPGKRARTTFARATRRHCPYCGGAHIFSGWFTLKERCPTCGVLFAYEDGYFLGSYAINLVVTEFVTLAIVIWMLVRMDLSVLQMQITGVVFGVGLPISFFPYALLLWMVIDLSFNPPGNFSKRPRI